MALSDMLRGDRSPPFKFPTARGSVSPSSRHTITSSLRSTKRNKSLTVDGNNDRISIEVCLSFVLMHPDILFAYHIIPHPSQKSPPTPIIRCGNGVGIGVGCVRYALISGKDTMNNRHTIALLPLCLLCVLSGCGPVGAKTGSLSLIYGVTASIATLVLLSYIVLQRKKDPWYLMLLICVCVVDTGPLPCRSVRRLHRH